MSDGQFWLTVEQFGRLEPHLPRDTRGKPRVDDRRVISGIVHVLKSGGRWADAPPVYGPRKTLYNRFVRWAAKGVWEDIFHALAAAGGPPAQVMIDSTAVRAHRSASGGKGGKRAQAIGRSRGGRTTKIHALSDPRGRPLAFLLTGGQVADCTAADRLLDRMPATDLLHGDKGYDSAAVRRKIEEAGAAPNIPPRANKRWKNCFSPYLYRNRNVIERMFGRLKDFRRIATRYDRSATNFMAAVHIVATVAYWL
ncbi:IS5-like element ISAzba5 family transposase (plasmid) [Azospirillum sp. A26]|uniref:IS5-like element ISAzba5 family transposase n=1 Tax=Azospirillum sp. A26 TaxID=3160607 RepID=UPI00366D21E9